MILIYDFIYSLTIVPGPGDLSFSHGSLREEYSSSLSLSCAFAITV